MFFRRIAFYLFALFLPALVGGLPSATAQSGVNCAISGNGELASGDYFKVKATIDADFSAKGSLMHATPWQSKAVGACPPILLERARVCRELERLDMSSPQCPAVSTALEENSNCVQNVLKGKVEAGLCARNGRKIISLGGSGTWNGRPGHIFNVTARDGGPDHYAIVITGPDGMPIEYTASGDLVSGDTRATVR
jgi:hypothetical protein